MGSSRSALTNDFRGLLKVSGGPATGRARQKHKLAYPQTAIIAPLRRKPDPPQELAALVPTRIVAIRLNWSEVIDSDKHSDFSSANAPASRSCALLTSTRGRIHP